MLKNGKLLGNGQLTDIENVTLDDEYAYIRLHFDVEIPTYLIDELEYVETIDTVCEVVLEDNNCGCNKDENKKPSCNKDKHDKEEKEEKDCHKKCDKDKVNKEHNCDKNKVEHNNKKQDKNNCKKTNFVKKTCTKVKKMFKKCFSK